jgi:hypothetical protein
MDTHQIQKTIVLTASRERVWRAIIDPDHDYSNEPMTLVTFALAEVEGGILLTITETGFDQIPLARRAQAIEANSGGWTHQTKLIEKYLALAQHI